LDDRHFESLRLNEDNAKKGDNNAELRLKAADLEKEIEVLKLQRQDNWREIAKLKDLNEQRVREAADQSDRLKGLDYDLSRVHMRIDDTQKMIDAKSYDLRNKQLLLEDLQKEIARSKDINARLQSEGSSMRRDGDKQSSDLYELRKENEFQTARNMDLSAQVRELEARLKDREDQLFLQRKDLEANKHTNGTLRGHNVDNLAEKEALEKHAQVLQIQNDEITRELDKFCEMDEFVRNQLDRRSRVLGLRARNEQELRQSFNRVDDARSRSPQRRY
jgi:chromosome segregation ATPase